jgi:hypothetical protein
LNSESNLSSPTKDGEGGESRSRSLLGSFRGRKRSFFKNTGKSQSEQDISSQTGKFSDVSGSVLETNPEATDDEMSLADFLNAGRQKTSSSGDSALTSSLPTVAQVKCSATIPSTDETFLSSCHMDVNGNLKSCWLTLNNHQLIVYSDNQVRCFVNLSISFVSGWP